MIPHLIDPDTGKTVDITAVHELLLANGFEEVEDDSTYRWYSKGTLAKGGFIDVRVTVTT